MFSVLSSIYKLATSLPKSCRNAAEGKGDIELRLREFNDGSCVELKGDFNRS